MTIQERKHANPIWRGSVLALVLTAACVGEVDTETSSSEITMTYEDAIAWADQTAAGEIRAALVTPDDARDLIALLRISADAGSWEDAAGVRRELVLDPDAVGDDITVLGRFPTTPEEAAMELYSIWTHHTTAVAYDGCRSVRTDTPCSRSGGSTCCQYVRFCDTACAVDQTPPCFTYNVYYDCYPDSGGGGGSDHNGCGNYF